MVIGNYEVHEELELDSPVPISPRLLARAARTKPSQANKPRRPLLERAWELGFEDNKAIGLSLKKAGVDLTCVWEMRVLSGCLGALIGFHGVVVWFS